jgi:hypothetical protein
MKLENTLKRRVLANNGYSTHIITKLLTQEVNRINIIFGRNIFKFDEKTND